jgi:hypothetical protein
MADLSDALNVIVAQIDATLYPSGDPGSLQPSPVTNLVTKIYPGWPQAKQLDDDLKLGYVHVGVFSSGGGDGGAVQVWEQPQIVVPPVHTIVPMLAGNVVTLSGTVAVNEYVTVILDGRAAFSYAAAPGDTLASMAAALATQIGAKPPYQATHAAGAALTIAGATQITVRIGAPGTLGEIVHRQRQPVRVIIYAATAPARDLTATTIDPALKTNWRLTFPDTSQGILTYDKTLVDDMPQKANMYRRDLVYTVEYATLNLTTAYEVTSIDITLSNGTATQPIVQ